MFDFYTGILLLLILLPIQLFNQFDLLIERKHHVIFIFLAMC